MSSGITPDSASRTLILVALYARVFALKHLFCSVASFATGAVPLSRIYFGEYHTGEPYVIAGRKTAV